MRTQMFNAFREAYIKSALTGTPSEFLKSALMRAERDREERAKAIAKRKIAVPKA